MSSHRDDLFDSVVFLEENYQKQGYDEGLNEGQTQGWVEGFESGWVKGCEMGNEVGFYKGFVMTWLACYKPNGNDRIRAKLESLSKILAQDWSDTSRDLIPELEAVRAKFKQICSMLNINIEYSGRPATGGLSF